LFGHFGRLIKNKYKITKELIGNFFSNEDMINKSPQEIIDYINRFHLEECSLTLEDKQSKVLDILKKIYIHINTMDWSKSSMCNEGYIGNFKYLERKYIPSYMYYSNLFWNKYVMFNDNYDGQIDELNYISFMQKTKPSFNLFVENKDELCVLEKYYVSLLEKSKESKKPKIVFKKKNKLVCKDELNVTSEDDDDDDADADTDSDDGTSDALYDNNDGNLSDDLDKALGIL
jgi:hypothetical protein